MYSILGRQNIYRNRDYAQKIAKDTGGEFLDIEFKDICGSYWVVQWRNYDGGLN